MTKKIYHFWNDEDYYDKYSELYFNGKFYDFSKPKTVIKLLNELGYTNIVELEESMCQWLIRNNKYDRYIVIKDENIEEEM